jgi:hypothetical protein
MVLVVAGQSNALGYQSFVVDPTTHKDVFDDHAESAADDNVLLDWDESQVPGGGVPPVPLDTPQDLAGAPSPVFGPEVGLARYLYGKGHKNLLIVKVAFSGSSLAVDWAPNGPDFAALVTTVSTAMSWARSNDWAPSIGAVYWVQGESDARSGSFAAAYASNLKKLIADVHGSLDLKSWTPFVIGEIDISDFIKYEQQHGLCGQQGCARERRWNEEVMKAQADAAGRHVFVTSTSKLPRYLDFVHLTNYSELELGKRFGELSLSHLS